MREFFLKLWKRRSRLRHEFRGFGKLLLRLVEKILDLRRLAQLFGKGRRQSACVGLSILNLARKITEAAGSLRNRARYRCDLLSRFAQRFGQLRQQTLRLGRNLSRRDLSECRLNCRKMFVQIACGADGIREMLAQLGFCRVLDKTLRVRERSSDFSREIPALQALH